MGITKALRLAAGTVLLVMCLGCASSRSTMVSFAPAKRGDPRGPQQLLSDFNQVMPFPIDRGDFVAGKAFDGTSCWVCLDDPQQTKILIAVLRREPDWRLRSVGTIMTKYRYRAGMAYRD